MDAKNTSPLLDSPEQILLVDDNTTNLQVLRHTLKGRDYRLLVAKSGAEALRIARKAHPALILLDVMMPGMDGFEVCRRLKADEATRNIAVIFLSALDEAEDKVHGLELGAVDYITKPFQGAEVVARVDTHLKIHRLERQLAERNRELECSNRHMLEQLIQAAKLESVGRLAAGVAHEVKNPLAVIQLNTDFLTETVGEESEVMKEVLADIDEAVRRADKVIKGLLDFSRQKATDEEPDYPPGQLNSTIEKSLDLVKHELTRHNIALHVDLAPNLPLVPLDRDKMQQVFINLFMNAIQAMGKDGALTVRTGGHRLSRLEDDWQGAPEGFAAGDTVVLAEVLDTGSGIDAAKADKVFDPFFTTKPVGQGTGLGLSVTRNIVRLHRAVISLRNRPQGGVAVRIMFKPQ